MAPNHLASVHMLRFSHGILPCRQHRQYYSDCTGMYCLFILAETANVFRSIQLSRLTLQPRKQQNSIQRQHLPIVLAILEQSALRL